MASEIRDVSLWEDGKRKIDWVERNMPLLRSYKAASEASGNQALVTIWAEDDTEHQRVIDVMNACAAAKIKDVSFAGGN